MRCGCHTAAPGDLLWVDKSCVTKTAHYYNIYYIPYGREELTKIQICKSYVNIPRPVNIDEVDVKKLIYQCVDNTGEGNGSLLYD